MKAAKVYAAQQYISTVGPLSRCANVQSHDPLLFRMTGTKIDGPLMENERAEPLVKPVLTKRMQQLAGLVEY